MHFASHIVCLLVHILQYHILDPSPDLNLTTTLLTINKQQNKEFIEEKL